MPINISNDLPARQVLEDEGVVVIREKDAVRQDIRPLHIALLNLMPEKIKTETQLARVLGATPLQVELVLLTTASYQGKSTPQSHMRAFYRTWDDVRKQKFDGLIITGAPVEQMPFEEVLYWRELTEILDWAANHVFSTFSLCWGAQAALYHWYGVPKHALGGKMFGVYPHRVTKRSSPLLVGMNDVVSVPVSRHTEVRREDVLDHPDLRILMDSEEAGVCLVDDRTRFRFFNFNHLEYDAGTLRDEYMRDLRAGRRIDLPRYYFPDDDPSNDPVNHWRSSAHLLFANWINAVYQATPFDRSDIGHIRPIWERTTFTAPCAPAPTTKPKPITSPHRDGDTG